MDSARESELRETLFSYISSGCNVAATARVLNCHKNTVAYRLRSAEAMLGRSFDRAEIGLGLALLATHWLSELLLHGAPSD